jgi:ElaB/YqjD/DUF883 family membrane-anchored ribosome-binding protein
VENQQLTATDKTPEQIQGEMTQTREALTEKVAALENQVVGTVQTAADTLTGTVESVKSLITSAPGAVSDTVKQAAAAVGESVRKTFNISSHVREHPWTSVGVSALLGCVAGWLISSLSGSRESGTARATSAPAYTPPAAPSERSGPGMFDELFSLLGRKVREVAENVIDTATNAVNKNVREGVPKLVDAASEMATDRLAPEESAGPRYAGFTG